MKSYENKQHDTDELKFILFRYSPVLVALIITIITGRYYSYGSTITFLIFLPFALIGVLWPWRNRKIEFFKRCVLAAPFTPALPIALRIIGFDMDFSIYMGIILFLALVIKADNWKQHFFITLLGATLFTIIFSYIRQLRQSENVNFIEYFFVCGLGLFSLIFYLRYLGALHSKKPIEWHSIAFKSFKFSAAIVLLVILSFAAFILCKHFNTGFWIMLVIFTLLSLGFLGFCFRFKINFSDTFGSNKKYVKNKNEKKCILCERSISDSEVPYYIKDHTVCEECYMKIEGEKAKHER